VGNRIVDAKVRLLDGVFDSQIEFKEGLNILAGENGTLKTQILAFIKNSPGKLTRSDPSSELQMEAISPKRNLELKATDQILQTLKQQDRTMRKLISELTNLKINDRTFSLFPSIGELFYLVFDEARADGSDQKAAMKKVEAEFNKIAKQVFAGFEIKANWDVDKRAPVLAIEKKGATGIPLDGLSLGESEVLAVALFLYASRDSYDVYLIDEPENHLNWHLEENLFAYFDWFCKKFHKQLIVATHSRAVFQPQFLPCVHFLEWTEGGTVELLPQHTQEIRSKLAGDAIKVVGLGRGPGTTFFLENSMHELVLQELARALGKATGIDSMQCGRSDIVKMIYKYSTKEGGWENAFFLIDGDNQGNPFPEDPRFIHLDAYCIENYLINPKHAAVALHCGPTDVQQSLVDAIKQRRSMMLGTYRWAEFLVDLLEPKHAEPDKLRTADASKILPSLLKAHNTDRKTYVASYVLSCLNSGELERVFPSNLIDAVRACSGE
jgi:hypothetical protein